MNDMDKKSKAYFDKCLRCKNRIRYAIIANASYMQRCIFDGYSLWLYDEEKTDNDLGRIHRSNL